ncbi:unnamed protein product (mitochondrion) [Plasmodiophora brassicae]|uniref:NAD(P)-binding domain-containing protein n=1 Tax=Plasmodiophora brassicae TaxID=37360 RepID=A0A0G4IPA9_PLABS|nr:hypothetical protein PBRA_005646 [Plasmodiophora brassicae]SPR01023.1 unnamed protein product [Plasmodiophora brassicae]
MSCAVVLGATGAVGRHVVRALAGDTRCQKIIAVVRRDGAPVDLFGVASDKVQVTVVDYNRLAETARESFANVDVAFSCLGTTRAQAGSAEAFKKVDLDYTVDSAKLLRDAGVPTFCIVSAANANANSWFLYPQTKGLAEQRLIDLEFPRLIIMRPMLIVRDDTDRLAERIADTLLPSAAKVQASQLARAMVHCAYGEPSSSTRVELVDHGTLRRTPPRD